MNRRDFLRGVLWMALVVIIESLVLWKRDLQAVYRLRAGKWERVRLFQTKEGDRIRFEGSDWKDGTEWIVVVNPWFSVRHGDWGTTAIPTDTANPAEHFRTVSTICWDSPETDERKVP